MCKNLGTDSKNSGPSGTGIGIRKIGPGTQSCSALHATCNGGKVRIIHWTQGGHDLTIFEFDKAKGDHRSIEKFS